jgi:hypothetical protein
MQRTVVVIGTWSSGSGAISDYLSAREDFVNPFGTNEFKIISDPMGLHHLFNNCYNKKDLLYASHAFENYEKYIQKVEQYKVYSSPGIKKKLFNKELLKQTREFLDKITRIQYYGLPHYKAATLELKKKIEYSLKKKFLNIPTPNLKILSIVCPVSESEFIKEAQKYISSVLDNNIKIEDKKKNIVINNGGDILDPVKSTRYYKNPKIICVLRDPRDIFCGMKMRQASSTPWYDVKIFINWYKYYFGNKKFREILENKKILKVRFEDFVLNFNKECQKISRFLNLKKKINLKNNYEKVFNIKFSKTNVYKSKKFLTSREQRIIAIELKDYLQW